MRQPEGAVEGLSGGRPPRAALSEGARLGSYRIHRQLGTGGWGVVYEALDEARARKVALKIFSPDRGCNPEPGREEERFVREASLAARIPRHPNLVGVYEAGILDGLRFIAMELVEGQPLDAWRRGATTRQQARVLKDVARAVHHAHEHGVLHRDLKPGNVLVDRADAPRVTDFGLAKNLNGHDVSLTEQGFVVGTPSYMSPEQAEGLRDLDPRSDVWALGVLLYEALVGEPPFVGKTPMQILLRAIEEPVVRPSVAVKDKLAPPVDPALEAVCLKALSKEREFRQPTARAFADALELWLDPKPRRLGLNATLGRWLLGFRR